MSRLGSPISNSQVNNGVKWKGQQINDDLFSYHFLGLKPPFIVVFWCIYYGKAISGDIDYALLWMIFVLCILKTLVVM